MYNITNGGNKKIIPNKEKVIDFQFSIEKNKNESIQDDIILIYVLEGSLTITIDDTEYCLNNNDMIIVNSNKRYKYVSKNEILLGIFKISYEKLSTMLNQYFIMFWCNSSIDKSEAYGDVERIIKEIMNQYFSNFDTGRIYLQSLYYKLLYILTNNFLLTSKDKRFEEEQSLYDDRINEIVNYIRANYRKRITLSELADKLYLSTAYLSKFIKKHLGMNYLEYLNNIRLNHAVSDLLNTKMPVLKIAMDNGFSNIAAFNKAFKDKYDVTPSEYKKKHFEKKDKENIDNQKSESIKKVKEYFEKNPHKSHQDIEKKNKYIIIDNNKKEKLYKYWNKVINFGTAADILKSNMQEHILLLKEDLNIEYIRFWDIYSKEMYLLSSSNEEYNFDKIDRVLDFLVYNNIKPYIELGTKPKKLLKNIDETLIEDDYSDQFMSLTVKKQFIKEFIAHLANRYGSEEVGKWRFELWKQELDLIKGNAKITETYDEYFELFDEAYKQIKSIVPEAKIGGAGLSIRFGRENLIELLKKWEKRKHLPDFLSLYCYPYVQGVENDTKFGRYSTDENYLYNFYKTVYELIQETLFKDKDLYISEWNFTISNRNVVNDSCFKGTYILKNYIDIVNKVDVLAYWLGSDLYADYYDTKLPINGGNGLLTKDGIKKPAYYAFKFLNKLGRNLISKGKNYIITNNSEKDIRIVCHNYKHLNYSYYLHKDSDIEIKEIDKMMMDNKKIKLSFQIKDVLEGNYQLEIYYVNRESGSIQNEWEKMSKLDNLDKEKIDYLKQICTPRIIIKEYQVSKNKILNFETVLDVLEIQYIHIVYKY